MVLVLNSADVAAQVAAEVRHLQRAGGRGSPDRHEGIVEYLGNWEENEHTAQHEVAAL